MRNSSVWFSLLFTVSFVIACGDDSSSTDAGDAARADTSSEAGFDSGPPEDCDTPGAVEDIPCGRCGTVERFCSAEGVWVVMGSCMGMGVCDPGTTEDVACGMCGTQTSRCTDACEWEAAGVCMGETGECTPGETQTTSDGCSGEDVRELTCNATCAFEETLECGPPPGVDIIFAVHARAWWDGLAPAERPRYVDRAAERIDRVISPLLTVDEIGHVQIGLALFSDFPVGEYGATGDSPAMLYSEPSLSAGGEVPLGLTDGILGFSGGDTEASGLEALAALAGDPHDMATPSSCTPGRVEWGCWRARSRRIVVLMSEVLQHGGLIDGAPHAPYEGIAATHSWSQVAELLGAKGTELFIFIDTINDAMASGDIRHQHEQMRSMLGLDDSHILIFEDGDVEAALTQLRLNIEAAL